MPSPISPVGQWQHAVGNIGRRLARCFIQLDLDRAVGVVDDVLPAAVAVLVGGGLHRRAVKRDILPTRLMYQGYRRITL